jgi:hypothetical protein
LKSYRKAEALKVFYEMHDKCKSCLMNCVNPNQLSSQIEETNGSYQIKMKCDLDPYAKKCLAPIIDKYKLTLKWEKDSVIIH